MTAARAYSLPHVGFEGPLEHLLDLIEKRKLLVNDVSLAAVADEYIAYARGMEEHPIEETSDFIAVASTLLLIKSKSLLPIFTLTESEEGDIKDLEHRLKLYQLFRDIAEDLSTTFGVTVLYERSFVPQQEPVFLPDQWSTLPQLHEAMRSILTNLPQKTFVPKTTVRKVISLEEMITKLEERIIRQVKLRFSDLTKNSPDHKTTIVSFLAILELVKQGFVHVRQEGRFDEIHIEKEGVDTPRYH
ncbi:MAG: segregation and condensation protein segregation and condensation protein [Candidatus Parcubacteria bacterium]|jgi:segregation and condensation protein A